MVGRKHRHIVELGLTLLAQALLPLTYWDHAFLTSVYLINRLPTSSLNFDIPFVKLYKQQPDFHFLRAFGCACFPLLRPYNKNKFQFRSQECAFLGHSPGHKGCKCLSSDGRIYISKDIVFNESKFPYPNLFSSSTSSHSSLESHVPITPILTYFVSVSPTKLYNSSSFASPASTSQMSTSLPQNSLSLTVKSICPPPFS